MQQRVREMTTDTETHPDSSSVLGLVAQVVQVGNEEARYCLVTRPAADTRLAVTLSARRITEIVKAATDVTAAWPTALLLLAKAPVRGLQRIKSNRL